MESTMVDFWTMIWEKKSHVIIMLSLLEEDDEVRVYICTEVITVIIV